MNELLSTSQGLLDDPRGERSRLSNLLFYRQSLPERPSPMVRLGRGAMDVIEPMQGAWKYLTNPAEFERWVGDRADSERTYMRGFGDSPDPLRGIGRVAITGSTALWPYIGSQLYEYAVNPLSNWATRQILSRYAGGSGEAV